MERKKKKKEEKISDILFRFYIGFSNTETINMIVRKPALNKSKNKSLGI